ncbi:MAG: YgiT-type zinc finger protein [Anaerolineales bacterium]|jgi:YgiT-type zinc finger domain-containing protein
MDEDCPCQFMVCPECQTGRMMMCYRPYFTWLHDELITVPDFPSWVCDLCGRHEYDVRAVSWLNVLLNPSTGESSSSRPQRVRKPPSSPSLGV